MRFWLCLFLLLPFPRPALCQQKPPTPHPASEASGQAHKGPSLFLAEFLSRLEALAVEGKLVFIVEGIPYEPQEPSKENPVPPRQQAAGTNSGASSSAAVPLAQRLAAFAEAYDYKPEYRKGVVLLRKRYSRPDDLPSVTYEESIAALGEAVAGVRSLTPAVQRSSLRTERVIDSLDEEQRAMLEAGKLSVATLRPEQQRHVEQWALGNSYDGGIEGTEDKLQILRLKEKFDPRLLVAEAGSSPTLPLRLALGHRVPTTQLRGTQALPSGMDTSIFQENPQQSQQPQPLQQQKYAPLERPATLEAVVEQMTAATGIETVATGKGSATRIEVDPAVAGKAVLLVGDPATAKTSLVEIATGLARLYDLSLETRSDGSRRLRRRRWLEPITPATLPAFLRRVLPQSVLRAIHDETFTGNIAALKARQEGLLHNGFAGEAWIKEDGRLQKERRRLEIEPITVATFAALRTQEEVLHLLKEQGSKDIPVDELNARSRDLLGLVLVMDFARHLRNRFADKPSWVTDLDRFVLGGRVYQDGKFQRVDLEISRTLENGQTIRPMEVSGALYKP